MMKKIITVILVCLMCLVLPAFSSCKKRTPTKLELRSGENDYPSVNRDNFSGADIDEFSSSIKEIKTRDDQYKLYSTMYDKIISDDIGIYVPSDEETITHLGVKCYQPFGSCGFSANEEGLIDYVEIMTRCIFTCGGTEYEVNFNTYCEDSSLTSNSAIETKTFELDGREVELVISKVLRNKYVDSLRYKIGEDTVTIMPANGDFFENAGLTDLPKDIFDLLEMIDLKKVSLKELIW